MSYQRGLDRSQTQLLPPSVEEFVAANAPVRFIDAFVDGLDLAALKFARAEPAATGRPPYDPADLLKLYLYGYLHRVRSSRRLEAEALRNLEVIWLLRGLRPDFKTIADFRKDNRASFQPLFKQFNLLCRELNLFGAELVAIDGCKFKALNNLRNHCSQKQLTALIARIDERIQNYLAKSEEADLAAAGAPGLPTPQELAEKIAKVKTQRGALETLLKDLKQKGQSERSLIDPDSRAMPKVGVGYNVQAAVDAKAHLIVAVEVVQAACDRGQLSAMAQAAQEELGVATLQVVADAGYHEADQLEACEKKNILTYVPDTGKTSGRNRHGRKIFARERFVYEAGADQYRCPAGQVLARGYHRRGRGKNKESHTYYNCAACRACPLKNRCTSARHRVISRRVNEAVVERQTQRLREKKEMMARRRETVEHVFGTFRNWGHDRFLMKGQEKVRGETNLTALSYNLRRVLNLLGVPELIQHLQRRRNQN
jgi:transposase